MHVLQRLYVVKVKEDVGSQDGSHYRADAIEGLRDVDSDFRVLGRATDCGELGSAHGPDAKGGKSAGPTGDVGVGSRLERTQSIADDEDADAEAGEGAVQDGRDCQQGAKAVEEEAPDEDGSIAVVAQDPGGVPKRSQGVGAGWVRQRMSVGKTGDGMRALGAKSVGEVGWSSRRRSRRGVGKHTHPK